MKLNRTKTTKAIKNVRISPEIAAFYSISERVQNAVVEYRSTATTDDNIKSAVIQPGLSPIFLNRQNNDFEII